MLGVKTEKGALAEELVRKAVLRLQKPGSVFAWFPKHNYFPVDGFIVKGNDITALFECKIRYAALNGGDIVFDEKVYDSLIISEDKIKTGVDLAKKMEVDFFLIAYLELSGHYLVFKIFDVATKTVIPYQAKSTWTKESINGGTAFRQNAFLKVTDALIVKDRFGEGENREI